MMSHAYSREKPPKPIGDALLNFVTWFHMFTFDENVFVSPSTMLDVHSNLSHYIYPKNSLHLWFNFIGP